MNPKILFVDTDRSFLAHLSSRLRQHDIHVVEQLGVNGVKEQLQTHPIGIVLIDMERIKGEGIMLIKSIKTSFPRTEIILLTNPEQISLSIEAMKLGPFEEIYLPLDIRALVKTIRKAHKRWEDTSRHADI
ncbi:response regulator [Desulfoplanes formicivorans]|uniref:Chemotaxis protein CheY n=1 Tax=Desulfoplanes formicivorans TaxID=1592317 RepID=A0A194ADA5_9BACT|nr:response regulator [Desulfoplanes formicivorans]GAU08072.1 chemotaxis protein CheY [Desulfoplanes formicivorans]